MTPPAPDRPLAAPLASKKGGLLPKLPPRRRRFMDPKLLVRVAHRNLWYRKLRTSLTIMGVVIGIGSITFLLSFGLGLQKLVSQQILGNRSVKTIDVTSAKSNLISLTPDNVDRVSKLIGSDSSSIARTYSLAGVMQFHGASSKVAVFGANQDYIDLSNLDIKAGSSHLGGEGDAIINSSVLKLMGLNEPKKAIGQDIKVVVTNPQAEEGIEFGQTTLGLHVIGVAETGAGTELFTSNKTFAAIAPTSYSQIKVVAKDNNQVAELRKKIEAMGFSTSSPLDTVTQINQVFRFFNLILAGFGGIGMVIAILGMLNTLTISLLERTREIALMISLGARRRDVWRLFAIEASLLSFLGGLLGVLAAFLLGFIVDRILNGYAAIRGVPAGFSFFSLPLGLVCGAILFMFIVGMAVVYFPARRASRINPIDVLRFS